MKIKKTLRTMFTVLSLFIIFWAMGLTASAASDTVPVYLEGTFSYQKAYEALNYTNQIRKAAGRSALQMDAELLEAAMQRAAEIQLIMSHTRPDGTDCFTASNRMYGENIAAGQRSAQEVTTSWKNSSGHYANMINSNFQSIGIGCFTQGSTLYWVQCFGTEPAVVPSAGNTGNQKRMATVNVYAPLAASSLYINLQKDNTLAKSKSMMAELYFSSPLQDYPTFTTAVLSPQNFTFSTADSSILTVNANGKLTAKKAGKTTLTVTGRSDSRINGSFTITVTDANSRTVKLNANGGSLSASSKVKSQKITVTNKKKYGKLPTPVRKGYVFSGWYTKKSGGTKITSSKKVSISKGKTQTLYAHWTKVTVVKPVITKAAKKSGAKLAVTWRKVSGAKGYEVRCSTSKKFRTDVQTLTVKASKKTATFRSLVKGQRYYLKVRAWKKDSLGNKVYSKYSTIKTFVYK